jgi:hypothetical protein
MLMCRGEAVVGAISSISDLHFDDRGITLEE